MNRATQGGLTLVELIISLVIVSILVFSAVPSFSTLINNSRATAEANDLLGFFVLARQQSILSGRIVTVCPVSANLKCGRNWNDPLYAFFDPENAREITDRSEIFRILPPPGTGKRFARSLSRSYFQYRPNGMIYSDLGNITWCPDAGNSTNAAHLIISRGGRIRLARDTDGDGVPNKADGSNVNC
jgi:type IV fimbrial biogenesis protein FimT